MLSLLTASLLLAGTWSVFLSGTRVPSGVALDGSGNVYVVDTGNSQVKKLSSSGRLLAEFGRLGTGDDGLRRPRGIAIGSDGTLFIADTANHRVQRFAPSGEPLGPWGAIGSGPGEFITPSSVALDEQGNLYVTDTGNHRLVRLAPDGSPNGEWSGFRFPHGIALGDGMYVSDESGVHKLALSGERVADWPGFGDPYGLTTAADGTLYVTDTDGGRVHVLSPQGDVLATWGSEGSEVGRFKIPEAVAVDAAGRVYVADRGNDRIQVLK